MIYRDIRNYMWGTAMERLEQAERLQRRLFQVSQTTGPGPSWQAPVDIFEDDGFLTILTALPGVAPDDVEAVIRNCCVHISGIRSNPALQCASILRMEIPYGRFERRVDLPPAPYEISQQMLVNGCLILTLRKVT